MSCFLGTAITHSEDIKRVREDEIKKRRSKKAISFFGKNNKTIFYMYRAKKLSVFIRNIRQSLSLLLTLMLSATVLIADSDILGNIFVQNIKIVYGLSLEDANSGYILV